MSALARQVFGKRREREGPDGVVGVGFRPPPVSKPRLEPIKPALPQKNKLLAGYLAHEFLTRGTLLGRPFDPARAEPMAEPEPGEVYADLARLMKFDGTHVPGVVNPTQLGCWIQKGKL